MASKDEVAATIGTIQRTRFWYGATATVLVVSILTIPLSNVLFSAALYFVAAFTLLMANLQAFLVVLLIVVRFAAVVISIAAIDRGAYVTEQFRYGFNNGSTAHYVPYLIIFIFVFHYFTHKLTARFVGRITLDEKSLKRYFIVLFVGYVLVNAVFALTLYLYGTAASIGGDRFVYWSHLPDQVRSNVMFVRSWWLSSLAVFLGFYTRYAPKPSVILLSLYGLTFVEVFLMGEKFAALFNNFFLFLTGLALAAIVSNKPIRLRLSGLLLAALVVLGLYLALDVGYQQLSGGRADSSESIADRITLEAHVWFGILDVGQGQPFVNFNDMWKRNSLESPSGLDFLSYLITSPSYVSQRLSGGIPFTMGGAPGVLAVFGYYGGMLVFALEAFFYPLVGFLFLSFLKNRMIILALVTLFGYNMVMLTAVMGYWDVYHSRTSYMWLAAMVAGQLIIAARNAIKRKAGPDGQRYQIPQGSKFRRV